MIKALLLIFDPAGSWERVVRAQRSLLYVLLAYLLPLVLLSCAAEAYGLARWGKWQGDFVRQLKIYSPREFLCYETLQFVLSLFLVFLGAKLVRLLAGTFHSRHTYAGAFTVVAYGLSPLFLFRALDAFPVTSPWLTWSVGIVLSVGVLYQGVPRVLQPDPPHAFGLFLTSALLLTMVSGLVRFVTLWWLQGKFAKAETFLYELISRAAAP